MQKQIWNISTQLSASSLSTSQTGMILSLYWSRVVHVWILSHLSTHQTRMQADKNFHHIHLLWSRLIVFTIPSPKIYGQLNWTCDSLKTHLLWPELWMQFSSVTLKALSHLNDNMELCWTSMPKLSKLKWHCSRLVTNKYLYPNIHRLLTILVTLPVTIDSDEWSFSTLHCLMMYLKSTMRSDRLTSIALLHNHSWRTLLCWESHWTCLLYIRQTRNITFL